MKTKTWKEAYKPSWHYEKDLNCSEEELTSLEGAPSRAAGDFNCANNMLTSLAGGPSHVDADFSCGGNLLTSLAGGPSHVDGDFRCGFNDITSLEGAPSYVGGNFICGRNELTSLKDIHLQIKYIGGRAFFNGNPIKSHVLGLLLIDGLTKVLGISALDDILNRYLPSKGMESVLLCQEELILAGYEEYAQL